MNILATRCPSIALALLAAGGFTQTAYAQLTAGPMLEEVLVTAQKREQSLQNVPVSVTAFSAETIERAGIRDFEDYAMKTPNVGFQQRGSRSDTKFGIRGVTNIGGQANAVGVYVDEVNVVPSVLSTGTSRTADTQLLDIERIEVLRGPQGTFFGRNTMGGAINITTVKPDPSGFDASVVAEVGEWDHLLGRAMVNVPLGDSVALRATVYYDENDGFITNRGPSGASNSEQNQGGRLALSWNPSQRLALDLSASWSRLEQDYPAMVPSGNLGSIPTQVVTDGGFLFDVFDVPVWPLGDVPFFPANHDHTATDMDRAESSDTAIYTARLVYDFDRFTLTSVTGYIDNEFSQAGEGDASVAPAFFVSRDSELDAFSQELRLSGDWNGDTTWMVGAIYARDETVETDLSTHLATDPYLALWDILGVLEFGLPGDIGDIITNGPSGVTVGNFEDVDRGADTTSYAAFGDMSWRISEHWEVAVGLRYTQDEVDYFEVTRPAITIPVSDISTSRDFDDWSPRLNVSWFPTEQVTIYGTVSKGYKVGGFNASQDLVKLTFEPEEGWNYELGLKSRFWNERVQLNAAAFYFDWSDLQVRGQDVRTQRQVVVNADSAYTQGGELELSALLTASLSLNLAYGYLDAEFDRFPNAIDTNGNLFDGSGLRIPLAPENTFSAALQYEFLLGSWDGFLRVDYSFIDDQFASADNSPERLIESYELWNLRAGIDNGHFGIQAFVENLADEEYSSGVENLETFYTGMQRSVGKPRWAGVRLEYNF
ncbi:TonB-dependent receptor [Haliea sp.]